MARIWKFGDGVNTDDILPGRFAPFMVGEDKFPAFAFNLVRPEFAGSVRRGDLLVGGRNWGLGSSREYAPQALKRLGVGGIIARSFARIHYRNLLNLGIPAFVAPDAVDELSDGDEVDFDLDAATITTGTGLLHLPPPPAFLADALREGSVLDYFRRYRRFPGEPEEAPESSSSSPRPSPPRL